MRNHLQYYNEERASDGFQRHTNNIQQYSTNNDTLINEINKLNQIKMRIRTLEENEGKWNQIEQNVKVNENKIEQMSQTLNNYVKNQFDDGMNRSLASQGIEYEKMVQENVTLKADTLIYREDVTQLSGVNAKLESELEITRTKVLELLNENDMLHKETEYKTIEIDKLTQAITRLRLFDNPDVDFTIENRKNKDQRIRELEYQNKLLSEEKIKIQIELKVLNERYIDYKSQQDSIIKEISFAKSKENDQITNLENRIKSMEQELDMITRENTSLRLSDDKYRRELTNAIKEKDNFIMKYQKKKEELNQLTLRLNELSNENKTLLAQRQSQYQIQYNIKKNNEPSVTAQENKQKIFSDLYNKIQDYKSKIRTKRTISP